MAKQANLRRSESGDFTTFHFSGELIISNTLAILKEIDNLDNKLRSSVVIDLSQVSEFDSHGVMTIIKLVKKFEANHSKVSIEHANADFEKLYSVCMESHPSADEAKKRIAPAGIMHAFNNVGKGVVESKETLIKFLSFVGGLTVAAIGSILNPFRIRFIATLYHIENSGVKALGIVFLTSFLIGVVIAFQGAVQLEKFGANIFIVEMVCISLARELAPLLTAIVVAGRSASSYTAEIGVMQITEEIDAMRTMGFEVWDFLILPRMFGLMIALPLLVFFADIVSIFGGALVAYTQLGLGFDEFAARMQETVEIQHVLIGLAKAPIFGALIATIGCFRGFQISSSTESVGRYTTVSVVNAIFWVIAADALISVFLTGLGL